MKCLYPSPNKFMRKLKKKTYFSHILIFLRNFCLKLPFIRIASNEKVELTLDEWERQCCLVLGLMDPFLGMCAGRVASMSVD